MAQCLFPFYVERKLYFRQEDRFTPVPCGKCPECLKRRVQAWAFRLEKEALQHKSQYFITLTYDDRYLTETPNGYYTLVKRDVQLFFKRLRKSLPKDSKIKYYLCGEYGSNTYRPHYHAILFGDENLTEQSIILAWICPYEELYDPVESKLFHPPLGHVHFGDVQDGSIKYTIQYYDKGRLERLQGDDDRLNEFALMSKGLGKNWLTNETARFIRENPDKQFIYSSGYKLALPAYYRRRLYDYRGTETMVNQHPSYVIEMAEREIEKKQRQLITKKLIDEKEQPDPADRSVHEDRKAAIDNYRRRYRKARC
ncbi:MAG: replication initiator protein [Microviridae sp.]|nr:MAG: replication initiator protein [Microviridae sp.]